MANTNKPTGLSPVRYQNGADWDSKGNWYYIDNTDTNAYNVGDLVKLAAGLDGVSGLPTITLSTAGGGPHVGVVLAIGASFNTTSSNRGGPTIDPTNLTLINAPATKTKNYFALVADDPMTVFEIQEVGTGTAGTKTKTSNCVNIVYAAPATGVAYSGTMLDNTTFDNSSASTKDLKLMGLVQRFDNGAYNAFGAFAKWLCLINNHAFRPSIGGV